MTYSLGDRQSRRLLHVFNASGKDIPPYACMMLSGYAQGFRKGFGSFVRDREAIWRVTIPNGDVEEDQNPAVLFFNMEQVIPAGMVGQATRDWPCKALHNGSRDGIGPGDSCGPQANEWWLTSQGNAFTCMGHDTDDDRVAELDFSGFHTMWVTGERLFSAGAFYVGSGSGVIPSGQSFLPALGVDFNDPGGIKTSPAGARLFKDVGGAIQLQAGAGLFDVSFSTAIFAPLSTERGKVLGVGCGRIKFKGGGNGTVWLLQREQSIEEDVKEAKSFPVNSQKRHAGKEVISISKPVYLTKGDILFLVNTSEVSATMVNAHFSVVQRFTNLSPVFASES